MKEGVKNDERMNERMEKGTEMKIKRKEKLMKIRIRRKMEKGMKNGSDTRRKKNIKMEK